MEGPGPGYIPRPIRARLGRHEKGSGTSVRYKQDKIRSRKKEELMRLVSRVNAMDQVRQLRNVRGTEKAVLFALVCHLDYASRTSMLSYSDLAADSGLSRSSVRRAVQALQGKGLLLVYHSPGAAHWAINVYVLTVDPELTPSDVNPTPEEVFARAKRLAGCPSGEAECPKNGDKMDKNARQRFLRCYSAEVAELFDHFAWEYRRSDLPDVEKRFIEKLGHYGIEANPTQCIMPTKSRKYDGRRCHRPATHGPLCGLHFRFHLRRLEARKRQRLQEVAAWPVVAPDSDAVMT